MKLRTLVVILTSALAICLPIASCSQPQKPEVKAKAAEDPRMAGFKGKIAKKFEDSKEDWPKRPQAPAGAPNVLIILLDDAGFAHLGAFGGLIETPNMDKLAAGGLIYTNFHTTALCSPSRAAIAAGRNHHSIGLGSHALTAMGFPGYNGVVPPQAAPGAKILQQHGFTTYALGKWDHSPVWEVSSSGPFNGWASGEGYDHYYGFMTADINNFVPIMYEDHWPTNPSVGKPDYHISTDMADRAIYWMTAQKSISPDRPFMMFWAPGATHAPHQAPKADRDHYKGKFDMGWDAARDAILKSQIAKGIFPAGTKLSERPADIPAWSTLSAAQTKMYARQMEAFAAQMTHVDREIGRMVATLERTGMLENTLIMITSDNGASGEGGLEGSHNEVLVLNGVSKTPMEENQRFYDQWGSAETDNHYHAGWAMAGNTPFKYFKQTEHNGGNSDALIVHWPKGIKAKGEIRSQYHHIIDIAPTFLDVVGIAPPAEVDGVKQMPLDGVSMKYSFNDAKAPTNHPVQYYEMYGNRAIYDHGWKAVVLHGGRMPWVIAGTFDFDKDVWELYNVDQDPGEINDLAAQNPQKLEQLKKLWDEQAVKYNVYPLYDDLGARFAKVTELFAPKSATLTYYPPGAEFIAEAASPPVKNRSHTITALLTSGSKTNGVIVASGGYFSGYTLYVKNSVLMYTYNYMDENYYTIRATKPLTPGKHTIKFVYEAVPGPKGKGTLYIDDVQVGQGAIDKVVLGKYSISEPFDVGADNGGSVARKEYTSPFKFNGQLDWVRFDLVPVQPAQKPPPDEESLVD
jgi:arylsulfatase A-like enzyme